MYLLGFVYISSLSLGLDIAVEGDGSKIYVVALLLGIRALRILLKLITSPQIHLPANVFVLFHAHPGMQWRNYLHFASLLMEVGILYCL
ncbi:hypothetical protein RHSIM_Rhsim02G0185500 [Rhododendron simsii]|uniref:Uncharacterized protein n=1 Tax=Rhododendron simsii TaxID=118357 RepID=A0A834HKA0_RHOSS|nr:hypothetical protein RHSIM_Rhsim02G0185500 [Rhododendron simsii]